MSAIAQTWTMKTGTRASAIFGVAAILVVVVAAAAPFLVSRAIVQDLFFILTMLVLAQNWNLLAGYAGLLSIGQQAFVGLGAYSMFGMVILLGIDPLVATLLAGFFAVLLAIPSGFFSFRLQGAYFGVGTWVIAEAVRLVVAQWKALGGGTGTSLPGEARKAMFGIDFLKSMFDMKTPQASDAIAYWCALVLAVATVLLFYRILRTRQGLGLAAVRDNETAARALGVNAKRMKVFVYLTTAFVTGITGALIYLQKARISPDAAFSVADWTAYVLFIVIIGGIGTIEGPIVGMIVFFVLQKTLSDFGSIYLLILGFIGIATMIFAPAGLWGLFSARTGIQLFPIRRRLVLNGSEHSLHDTRKGGFNG
ncbi:branched-chain amino acid ABC transporter permease [Allorhizobium sp. BGMRC 0089]|uniref:branched-chain amino acid ABC transporter permease n=1 Tax=Allorhizobium sonneratiae TaxID=2934936 RepID=UPI002033E338|nr:branched-chain amino acid ABC transporter permease [Allorhizobium sonneratiae]MCM2293806.1 branched-chain amino acid ABC transporter permease [Allorhizobium sonneratiae]